MQKPKRILILGPESTGKSTLAEDLANHFGEPWVPEFAREYLEKLERPYQFEDLTEIGKGQVNLEDQLAEKAQKFIFCDTDLRVIHIWSEHRFGKTETWILEAIQRRNYDLILLTDTDLPWGPDPLREYPELEMRQYFFEKYRSLSVQSGFPFLIVSGDRAKRLKISAEAVEKLGEK
jgi:NadR type nicotinamide-nucleotide adenylyltransferase